MMNVLLIIILVLLSLFVVLLIAIGTREKPDKDSLQQKSFLNSVLIPAVRQLYIEQNKSLTLPVRGYSMRPFIEHERDCVVLKATDDPQVGDAVLAEVFPNVFVLHRIIHIDGDMFTLQGDGNIGSTERCHRKNIIARVTHYVYPNRTISADNRLLCACIWLWRRLRPIRRWLLVAYKLITRQQIRNKSLK